MDIEWTQAGWWLVRSALGATLLLCLALILMRRLPQPARRQRLGEFSLFAAVVICAAGLAPTWLVLPWFEPEPQIIEESAAPLVVAPREAPALPALAEMELVPFDAADERFEPVPEAPASPPVEAAWTLSDILPYLLAAYVAIVGFFVLRWLLGHWLLFRLARACRPAPENVWQAFAQFLAERGANKPPRLLVSTKLRVPISFGVLRPTIVLPSRACEAAEAHRLGWIFAHEVTHLERRDALSATLLALGQALFFYLPWFWWLKRQIHLCQEYVADAAAAESGPADEYAEFLLSWTPVAPAPLGATGVFGKPSDLFRRITMLLSQSQPIERRCPRLWTCLVGGGLIALAFFLGGVSLSAQEAGRIIIVTPATPVPVLKPLVAEPFEIRLAAPDGKDVIFLRVPGPKDGKDVFFYRAEGPVTVPFPGQKVEPVPGFGVIKHGDGEFKIALPPGALPPGAGDGKFTIALPPGVVPPGVPVPPGTVTAPVVVVKPLAVTAPPMGAWFVRGDVDVERIRKLVEKLKTHPDSAADIQKELLELLDQGKAVDTRVRFVTGDALQRLGAKVARPTEILVEHLNLKKDHGLLVTEVTPGSPAAKAGLKTNDIILKAADKAVTSDPAVLSKVLGEQKGESSIVVLRRGKEETVRLPAPPDGGGAGHLFKVRTAEPVVRTVPLVPGDGVMTTTLRTGERFTTRHQEGSLIITVTGKVVDGKAQATEISVQDGAVVNRYETIEAVPAAHADKVRHLIGVSGGLRVEK